MIKFLPLGGADDIGASCYFLEIDGTGILLDCGIHPRKKGKDSLPDFSLLDNLNLDFVLITHAHQDHIGSLPFLVQKFPHVIITSTIQTKEIAEITLHNAANILKEQFEGDDLIKPYSHEEIDLIVRSIKTTPYNEVIEMKGLRHLSNEPIKVSFHDAGHILGSAGILVEFNGRRIFYTGDIKFSSQQIMEGAILPQGSIDTLITETTYGATDSEHLSTWENEAKRFANSANKILNKGGSILIPVFALGKTQEIMALIKNLQIKRALTEMDIYTGGVGREISRLYDNNRYIVNRHFKDMELLDIPQTDLYSVEDYQVFLKKPGVVLASSGMMIENTASYRLAKFWLNQKDSAIFIVGYVDVDSPGYQLLNKEQGESVQLTSYSEPTIVQCKIERFYFASHSQREELLYMVDRLKPKRVILLHGDFESKSWLGNQILNKYNSIKMHSSEVGTWINF